MLHKKELVLNQDQTKNLLDTIKILDASRRKASSIINKVNNNQSSDNSGVTVEHLELNFEQYRGTKDESENVAKAILNEINRRK